MLIQIFNFAKQCPSILRCFWNAFRLLIRMPKTAKSSQVANFFLTRWPKIPLGTFRFCRNFPTWQLRGRLWQYQGLEFPKSSGKMMALDFPTPSHPGISEAYSCNLNALSLPRILQPGISGERSGSIVALSFPTFWQLVTSEVCSDNVMVLSFPKASQPGIAEAYSGILWLGISRRFPYLPSRRHAQAILLP